MSSHGAPSYDEEVTALSEQGRLLSVNEVAYFLGVSRDSVYRLVRKGVLPYVRVGDRLRFRPVEIDAYLTRERRPT